MSGKMMKKSRVMLLGVVAVAALTMGGCGTSGYDNPAKTVTTTKTASALVGPAQVKEWMDAGLVNKQGGYDRVVILEVSGKPLNYAAEHIPGAIFVNLNELTATRVEGPAEFGSMVATGAQMDTLIKRCGIDENTTVEFTTSTGEIDANTLWNLSRGYTTFRYWGFPKERLKVLDAGNKGWTAPGRVMTSAVPVIVASNYAVAPNNVNKVKAELRASLSEMMAAVAAGDKDFIDGRPSVAGGTQDLIDTTKYVVFEGRLKNTNFNNPTGTVANSRILPYLNLVGKSKGFKSINDYVDVNDDDGDGNTTETMDGLIKLLNIQSDTAYTLCRAGNIASVLFFAIDGHAYYDGSKKAVWYDGSWGQWGLMASSDTLSRVRGVNAGGKLPVASAWSTLALTDLQADNPGNTAAVSVSAAYNVDFVTALATGTTPVTYRPVIDITSRLLSPAPAFPANQLEEADKAYLSPVVPSTGGSSSGGGGC